MDGIPNHDQEIERQHEPAEVLPDPPESESEECLVPPAGWRCTRRRGHDGPCAAVQDRRYWHLADPKMRLCKHSTMERLKKGMLMIDRCKKCGLYFWPK